MPGNVGSPSIPALADSTADPFSAHTPTREVQGEPGRLSGITCLVTGANTGIGKEIARGLALNGGTVAMVCRDPIKGERARADIVASTGNRAVKLFTADLSLQSSVRRLAQEFRAAYDSLGVLVNNAGVLLSDRTVTAEGFETTLAVNHLAPFLFTSLLLDLLKHSAPSRVVTLGSASHARAIDFGDLQAERSYAPMKAYGRSKLANILFTYELARRLEGSGVTVNCVDPGLVRTEIVRDIRGVFRLLIDVTAPFYRSPARGARTVVYLASAKEVDGLTGRYFKDEHEIRSAPVTYAPGIARRLWEASEQMTGLATTPTRGHLP
jgi:NAD(P)-dependent dehydrogenase (short-subunit alcohol dehydrogenase family)